MSAQGGAPPRLGLGSILAFSGPSFALAGMGVVYGVYIGPYLTGVIGVPLTVISGAFLMQQLLTLFLDPALGWAMDRTRTRVGRFRPWAVASTPIFLAGLYAIFMAQKGIGFGYLLGWGLVIGLGTSMLTLSTAAWGANIAASYNDRSRLYGVLGGVGGISAIAFLGLQLVLATPHPGWPNNVQMTGWVVIVLMPIAIVVLATFVREPVSANARTPFALKDYREMVARPEMVRLIAADLCLQLGPGATAPIYLFFFRDVLGFNGGQEAVLLMMYTAAAVFGGPVIGWIATRYGKHRTLAVSTIGYAIFQASLFIVPKGLFIAAIPGMFGCGFIASGFLLLVRAMVADVGDEVRLEQDKERMSLLYSMVTTTTKIGTAITLPVTYSVLAAVGYQTAPGAINTAGAIRGLTDCYVFAPIIFVLIGGACMIGYKLDAKRHAGIREQLALRDAGLAVGDLVGALAHEVIVPPTPAE
ncbi:MAG TPA: MFS transporter [Caulobacteraceae bacterium]|jgi:Na+/melibiose symporter-like transporter